MSSSSILSRLNILTQLNILSRLNMATTITTVVVWCVFAIIISLTALTLQQSERETALHIWVEEVEFAFNEIVTPDNPFEHQSFDYQSLQEGLDLDENAGMMLWYQDRLMLTALPSGVTFSANTSPDNPVPLKPAEYLQLETLFPDDNLVGRVTYYPEFELTLLIMMEPEETKSHWHFLILLLVAALLTSLMISGLVGRYLNSRALKPLGDLATQLSLMTGSSTEISIKELPEELKGLGSEINRIYARFASLQLEKDVALDKERLFTVNAAHELLTPLTVLKAEVQLVASQYKGDKFADSLSEINLRLDRVTKTIEQLVNLARLEPHQAHPASYSQQDLRLLFEDNQALLGEEIEMKQLQIVTPDIQSDPIFIAGNQAHLNMLFKNLIENAVKYTPAGCQLSYQFSGNSQQTTFTLENQCEPIPDYMKEQLFDAFSRRPGETQSGSGLGLAIVKQICHLHHYQIQMCDAKQVQGVKIELRFFESTP